MEKRIYIEPETLETAERNFNDALREARETIQNGTPDEIREAIRRAVDRSSDYRAFIRANYNI